MIRLHATSFGWVGLLALGACGGGNRPGFRPAETMRDSGTPVGDAEAGTSPSAEASVDANSNADAASPVETDSSSNADALGADGLSGDGAALEDDADRRADSSVSVTPQSDGAMREPVCGKPATWSTPSPVPGLLTFATQPWVTMTSDERTVAWVIDAGEGRGLVFVAERASPDAAFGTPTPLTTDNVQDSGSDAQTPPPPAQDSGSTPHYFAFERVALSGDALTLVGVAVDGGRMAQFIRSGRGAPFFAAPLETRYDALRTSLSQGERLGDPVLSDDGDDFVYSKYGDSLTTSIYESFQSGTNSWPPGSPQQGPPLQMLGSTRKRPTYLSTDRLTLFVWDEGSQTALAAFRGDATQQFNFVVQFNSRFSLQANATCRRLYYVAPASVGFQLNQVDAN